MKKLVVLAILLLAAPAWAASPIVRSILGGSPPPCDAAASGAVYIIADPAGDADCTVGSAAPVNPHVCVCDGSTSTWVADFPDNHEKVSVDATGRVGIGTTPSTLLHLYDDTTGAVLRIESGDAASSPLIEFKNAQPQLWQFGLAGASESILLYDATGLTTPFAIEKACPDALLYLDSQGYVGIGTSSPAFQLDIDSSTDNSVYHRIRSTAANSAAATIYTNDAQTWVSGLYSPDIWGVYDDTGSKPIFTIEPGAPSSSLYVDSTGKVGMGTSSPSTTLHVYSASTNAQVRMQGNGGFTGFLMENTGATGGGYWQATHGGGGAFALDYSVRSGQELRITTSGSLLLDADITFEEMTPPSATTNYGTIWTESDNELHFFDGSGTEHVITASYAAISVESNATVTALTVSTPAQITVFNTNGPSQHLTPDHTTDDITVDVGGDYFVLISASLDSSGGTGSTIEVTARKNNGASVLTGCRNDRTLAGGGGESGAITVSCIVTLTAADTVEAWAENLSNGDDVVFDDISLVVDRKDY